MTRRRHLAGSIEVNVDVDDLVRELSDEQVMELHRERFGSRTGNDPDLLVEIAAELMMGRMQSALALITSAQTASSIDDAKRLAQYQAAGRA